MRRTAVERGKDADNAPLLLGGQGRGRARYLNWMSTDLTSEFTHFNSVIHLSMVQQMALLLSTVFGDSRCSGCPLWTPWNAFLLSEAVPNIQKLLFTLAAFVMSVVLQHTQGSRQAHVLQVWYSFFWWFFGEVKHFVHLIRWNLIAVLCHWGKTWPRSRCRE